MVALEEARWDYSTDNKYEVANRVPTAAVHGTCSRIGAHGPDLVRQGETGQEKASKRSNAVLRGVVMQGGARTSEDESAIADSSHSPVPREVWGHEAACTQARDPHRPPGLGLHRPKPNLGHRTAKSGRGGGATTREGASLEGSLQGNFVRSSSRRS